MLEKYNGWTNWETWSVAVLISNNLGAYLDFGVAVTALSMGCEGDKCERICCSRFLYEVCIWALRLFNDTTPDGVRYLSECLDTASLSELLREMSKR